MHCLEGFQYLLDEYQRNLLPFLGFHGSRRFLVNLLIRALVVIRHGRRNYKGGMWWQASKIVKVCSFFLIHGIFGTKQEVTSGCSSKLSINIDPWQALLAATMWRYVPGWAWNVDYLFICWNSLYHFHPCLRWLISECRLLADWIYAESEIHVFHSANGKWKHWW